MTLSQTLTQESNSDIITLLADNLNLSADNLRLFPDFSEFLTNLLQNCDGEKSQLYVVGTASADLAIIADRADIAMVELPGSSPFSADIDELTEQAISSYDIIYLSNPNRVTGATLASASIEMLANAVPDGLLIVDEKYFDFYGVSALPLLDNYSNIIILRSFAATFGIHSAESGFAVSSKEILNHIAHDDQTRRISAVAKRMVSTILGDQLARSNRLAMVHGESLRIAGALSKLGIQNRISATDFILFRVEDPTVVGNAMARYRVTISNLDGYPRLRHYLRYRIGTPSSNDEFIRSFSRMPLSSYRMTSPDNRLITLRKGAEQEINQMDLADTKRLRTASFSKTSAKPSKM